LPNIPVVVDTLTEILAKVQQASDEFANKYGLRAKVSFDGWYAPHATVLIEYTKA